MKRIIQIQNTSIIAAQNDPQMKDQYCYHDGRQLIDKMLTMIQMTQINAVCYEHIKNLNWAKKKMLRLEIEVSQTSFVF